MGSGNLFSFKIHTTSPALMCAGGMAGLGMEQVKAGGTSQQECSLSIASGTCM